MLSPDTIVGMCDYYGILLISMRIIKTCYLKNNEDTRESVT
jgi:hypothetical protein